MKLNIKKISIFASIAVVLIMATAIIAGCAPVTNGDLTAEEQRENAIETRAEIFERAEAMWPVPQVSNFLAREMLVKYVERQDVPSHLFYIYVLSDFGTCMGYYVAQAAPVNTNAFLSSTESVYHSGHEQDILTTAPSIDGIFYGGSGSSQGGDNWFFFDAESDALVILYGMKMFVSDAPLNIDAPRLTAGGASITLNTSGQ